MANFKFDNFTMANPKHARILHAGNMVKSYQLTVNPTIPIDPEWPVDSIKSDNTVDQWRPAVDADTTTDFRFSWTRIGLNTTATQNAFIETSANGVHQLSRNVPSHGAQRQVGFLVDIEPNDMAEISLVTYNGSSFISRFFNFDNNQVSSADSFIEKINDNRYLIGLTGFILNPSEQGSVFIRAIKERLSTYSGSARTFKLNRADIIQPFNNNFGATAFIGFNFPDPIEGLDTICIAGHNLVGSSIFVLHRGSAGGLLNAFQVRDNSPIMIHMDPSRDTEYISLTIYSPNFPQISMIRFGKALVMQRPFYGGYSPTPMNRATAVLGNISGSGELLGRSRKRTVLNGQYSWENLSYDWVRENLEGPRGLIENAEKSPVFISWRPGVNQDVDLIMKSTVDVPLTQGRRDLMTFGLSGEVHSYE